MTIPASPGLERTRGSRKPLLEPFFVFPASMNAPMVTVDSGAFASLVIELGIGTVHDGAVSVCLVTTVMANATVVSTFTILIHTEKFLVAVETTGIVIHVCAQSFFAVHPIRVELMERASGGLW